MKKQQAGFTLIELVVVIVILGILAATAIPRFADLTDNARTAVAEGVLGAILSSAVIQFGANNGNAVTMQSIIDATDVDSNETVEFELNTSGTFDAIPGTVSAANQCQAVGTDDSIIVRVGGAGGQTASGIIPGELCSG